MGAAIKIAVSFLAHIREEIGAFKYKGRDFLGSNPLLLLIPLGQERKGRAGHLIESFLPPTTCCLSEKLAAAPFITCLVPSHAPTSLHLSRLPTVHKLLPSLTARAFSLCLHLNSLVFIRSIICTSYPEKPCEFFMTVVLKGILDLSHQHTWELVGNSNYGHLPSQTSPHQAYRVRRSGHGPSNLSCNKPSRRLKHTEV